MAGCDRVFTILMVDDDAEDRGLVRDALSEVSVRHRFRTVGDGDELLEYLNRSKDRGGLSDWRPDLLLLDLNLPRRDGRELLCEVRRAATWRTVPVVVLTTSMSDGDIAFCYAAGANSFITKPSTYRDWMALIKVLITYWFEFVQLPRDA